MNQIKIKTTTAKSLFVNLGVPASYFEQQDFFSHDSTPSTFSTCTSNFQTAPNPAITKILPIFNVHEFDQDRKFSWQWKLKEADTPLDVFYQKYAPQCCIVEGKETETYRRIRILARNEDRNNTRIKKQIKDIETHTNEATVEWAQGFTYHMESDGTEIIGEPDKTYSEMVTDTFAWVEMDYFPNNGLQV